MKQKLGPKQKAWVKALRSGKFKQTEGVLKDKNGYCCLGVLCELEEKLTKNGYIKGTDNSIELPNIILKKYGFNSKIGSIKNSYSLAARNDDGISFKEIANFIEQNPEKVFTKLY